MIIEFQKSMTKEEVNNKLIRKCIPFKFLNSKNVSIELDDLYYLDLVKLITDDKILNIKSGLNLRLVTRINQLNDTIIEVGKVKFGGGTPVIIAGPCAVENQNSMELMAKTLISMKVDILRAGAFKPRTNPYSFQGIGDEGLKILKEIKNKYQIPVISEITSINDIEKFEECVDIIQIGARNMQNFELLKAVGKSSKPILLKRGFNNSLVELLCSAEYIMLNGNKKVILCERGIRTPLSYTRNTLDLSAVAILKLLTHLPIIVDPSHSSGKAKLVAPLVKAAFAMNADGVMIEAHPQPYNALSDQEETISFEELQQIVQEIKK